MKQINVKLPDEQYRAFKRACLDLDTSMSVILRRAIEDTITMATYIAALECAIRTSDASDSEEEG